jgi:hypothetical protein
MNTEKTTNRKVLVPLATVLVAGAVAVGSGATFTSESNSAAAVTSGILKHANTKNAQTLTVSNIKPGDSQTGSLTITNNGSLDSTLTLEEYDDSSAFQPGALELVISQGAKILYAGDFGALDNATRLELGALNVGDSTTVTYTVSMPQTAGNENQDKAAGAKYRFVTTQSGDNGDVKWVPGL